MTLFDPENYTKPGRTARKPREARKPATKAVPVRVDGRWRVVVQNMPGLVHFAMSSNTFGLITRCGRRGAAHTFENGTLVDGCLEHDRSGGAA